MSVTDSIHGFCNVVVWLSMMVTVLAVATLMAGLSCLAAAYVWEAVATALGRIW